MKGLVVVLLYYWHKCKMCEKIDQSRIKELFNLRMGNESER